MEQDYLMFEKVLISDMMAINTENKTDNINETIEE
jgi:hypothetical protein